MWLKEIGPCAQNMLVILSSIVNMVGGFVWPLNGHGNLYFDNEWDIHMSFKFYVASGYGHD
jgi:hypothetical protein